MLFCLAACLLPNVTFHSLIVREREHEEEAKGEVNEYRGKKSAQI